MDRIPFSSITTSEMLQIQVIDDVGGGMSAHARRVAAFILKAGQEIPLYPSIPRTDVLRLRCLLLLEETLEFIEAAGFGTDHFTSFNLPCSVGERFGITVFETGSAPSYEGMIDACADVSVVNTGTLIALGAGDNRVLRSVDTANLAKVSGQVTRTKNGKIKKPEGWMPPKYECVEEYERLHEESVSDPVTDDFGEGIPLPESES